MPRAVIFGNGQRTRHIRRKHRLFVERFLIDLPGQGYAVLFAQQRFQCLPVAPVAVSCFKVSKVSPFLSVALALDLRKGHQPYA